MRGPRAVSYRLRRVTTADARALVAVPGLFDRPVSARSLGRYLREPSNVMVVAHAGGRAVGFVRGTTLQQPHTSAPQMFLYEIEVRPEARHHGIGRALVERLLRYSRSRGYDEMFVLTTPDNRAATRLYEATGGIRENPAERMYVYPFSSKDRAARPALRRRTKAARSARGQVRGRTARRPPT